MIATDCSRKLASVPIVIYKNEGEDYSTEADLATRWCSMESHTISAMNQRISRISIISSLHPQSSTCVYQHLREGLNMRGCQASSLRIVKSSQSFSQWLSQSTSTSMADQGSLRVLVALLVYLMLPHRLPIMVSSRVAIYFLN